MGERNQASDFFQKRAKSAVSPAIASFLRLFHPVKLQPVCSNNNRCRDPSIFFLSVDYLNTYQNENFVEACFSGNRWEVSRDNQAKEICSRQHVLFSVLIDALEKKRSLPAYLPSQIELVLSSSLLITQVWKRQQSTCDSSWPSNLNCWNRRTKKIDLLAQIHF